MENKSLKIGILGLGLIGGSILKALFEKQKYQLFAVSKSSYKKAEKYAKTSDDVKILSDCDLVFVCSKMSETNDNLEKLNSVLPENTIVSDVCSIKGFLKGDYKFNFIPSHPMAGTEFFGFENSFKELFYGAKWIICKENKLLREVIEDMGAKPYLLNENEHDIYAAMISHLPMLISTALFESADENALKIASSGFRDTTRLALTNEDLAYDMLNYNRENILKAYQKFGTEIEKILSLSEDKFKIKFKEIARKRGLMYDKDGKNKL